MVVLLPLFFAYSGLRTNIGIAGRGMWWIDALLVIVVAITGKLGGSMIAARLAGMPWRDAASLGILMNTRGLMALVTTFMATPLLEWTYPARLMRTDIDELAEERPA